MNEKQKKLRQFSDTVATFTDGEYNEHVDAEDFRRTLRLAFELLSDDVHADCIRSPGKCPECWHAENLFDEDSEGGE